MDILAFVLVQLLLVPYVGWGCYLLVQRYRYHEEPPLIVEAVTIPLVLGFLMLEIFFLRAWLQASLVNYIFALLGLLVSFAALYGPVTISLISRLVVDFYVPEYNQSAATPRWGPVEALEEQGDFEDALQECYVIARIFPRDPNVHLHIADNHLRLQQPEEAAQSLQRALRHVNAPEENLYVLNQLCEVYQGRLNRPEAARQALAEYVQRFPTSEDVGSVQERIQALEEVAAPMPEWEDSAVREAPAHVLEGVREVGPPLGSFPLTETPEEPSETPAPAPDTVASESTLPASPPQPSGLSSLEESPLEALEPEAPTSQRQSFQLEAMDTPLPEQEEEDWPPKPSSGGARLKLESKEEP